MSRTIAPEDPLDGNDCKTRKREVDHRKSVLPANETRIEEADAGHHYPYERGRCKHPGAVAHVEDDFLAIRVRKTGQEITRWHAERQLPV